MGVWSTPRIEFSRLESSPEIRQLADYATAGFALGVDASQGKVYAAEGGGLSIWEHLGSGKLRALGRYRPQDNAVRQVVVIDISNPEQPQLIDCAELKEHPGLIAAHNGTPIIPAGYQGLVIWNACGSH